MSKQKKLLGVSDLNLNIKPYQEEQPKQESKQESSGFQPKGDGWDWFFKPTLTGDATLEALKQPGAMFNKGASQLMDNPLAGTLNMAQGLVGIPFLMATVPLAFGEDMLKTFDKTIGTTKEGKPSGAGNFISEGLNGVFETPPMIYDNLKKGIDLGLNIAGINPADVDAKLKQGMIATRLMPKDATEEQFRETQESLDEAGKLGATILAFEGVKLAKNKIAPKVDKINVIPKGEVPQDVKQTLQLEAPKKQTFNQINVDPTGRNKTIPKTENTQAYTKLELLRDEISAKKDKLVSDRDILKKQAFDKNLTKEQRIDAKNKLKLVTEELNDVSKRLPLINKELEAKRFEVESKPIPEQKLLTEYKPEPIPTENTNINPYTGQGSKVDFTVATDIGAKTTTNIAPEKLPGVKRGSLNDMADKIYNFLPVKYQEMIDFSKFKEDIKLLPPASEIPLPDGSRIKVSENGAIEIISTTGKTERRGNINTSDAKNTQPDPLRKSIQDATIIQESKLGDVAEVQRPTEIIERRTETEPTKTKKSKKELKKEVEPEEVKQEQVVTKIKPIENHIVEEPRSELPPVISDKILENAQGKLAQIEGAEILRENAKFQRENRGEGWEVTKSSKGFTYSSFPEWFRDLGKSKKEIVNALEKIIEDKGKDKGKLVEDIKAIILDHLKNGEEDYVRQVTSGQSTRIKRGEIPADTEINDFLSRFNKNEVSLKELQDAYKQYESEASFNFGENVLELKSPEIKIAKKPNQQIQMEGLGQAKMPDKPITGIGKGEETTPLFNQPTEVKGQTKLFGRTEPAKTNATIDRLRQEALDEFKNRQSTPSGFNPLDYKAGIKLGAYHIKNGVVKFADWSAQMIKDLGEKIKPQLLRIWNEVKRFGEDLGKIAVDKIGEFIDSKYNPARPLKIVDQSLFERPKKTETKSAFSEGMQDLAQKDRQTIKNEYREAIKEKEKFSTKAKNLVKEVQDIKKVAKTVFEPISTSVEKVSKDVFRRFRMFGQSYQTNLLKRHEVVGDYFDVKSKSKMSDDVKADFDISLMNGWFDDARKIAKEYGFEKQLDNVLKIKDDLAKELGVKTIENHFPRMVEDFNGFVKFLEEKYPDYYKDNFSRMISEKANKIGRELTSEEKANLINNSLRGYNPSITLSDTGNMRKRIIQTLDGELAKFYHTPDASLLKYINEMTELSESRKFFGKGVDINESIGSFIQELRDGKKLDIEGSKELMEVFKARFNQRSITNKGITALRDIGVITKLGNPYSTMTQLKDLAYSLYFDPLRTPIEFGKVLGSKITGKTPEWQIKELGIDPLKIAEELANPKKRNKIAQGFLDYSGFSKLDMIGKETLINTLWNKYQKQSKDLKLNAEFERRIERYFGKGEEKTKVLNDLRSGKKTDSTSFLLYNELVGAQPISLTEMPRGYLKGGNWRIAYFLKTFSIRQLDFALNETVRVLRDTTLPKEQRRQGAYNLMKLGTALALTGATVDQIRSYVMNALTGKKNDQSFSEDMLDNILNVALLSKFDYKKARQNGLDEALGSKILPPMDFISDPLIVDLPNVLSEKGKALQTTKHIPMVGRFLYEYLKSDRSGNSSRNTSRNTRR